MISKPVGLANNHARMPGIVQWYGGKGQMVAKILPLITRDGVYVEPYGGAASIMMALPPRQAEVYNDLDGRLINLFRVLQDKKKLSALIRRLRYTPCSRDEYILAIEAVKSDDPVESAWGFFVTQNQGFGGDPNPTPGNWAVSHQPFRSMPSLVSSWRNRVGILSSQAERMSRVQIDSRDAITVINSWDRPDAIFYLDPPYVHATRSKGQRDMYSHEQPDSHHTELVETLLAIKGRAVLSGYDSPIYEPLRDAGWTTETFDIACTVAMSKGAGAGAANPRTECLWISPNATRGTITGRQMGLLDPVWTKPEITELDRAGRLVPHPSF